MKFTILGQPPSKSNNYKMTCKGKYAMMYKSAEVKAYEQSFFLQCPVRNLGLGRYKVLFDVYFSSDRPDLGNAEKVLGDMLQSCGVVKNDRKCDDLHLRKFIDKKNPRVEITLEEV